MLHSLFCGLFIYFFFLCLYLLLNSSQLFVFLFFYMIYIYLLHSCFLPFLLNYLQTVYVFLNGLRPDQIKQYIHTYIHTYRINAQFKYFSFCITDFDWKSIDPKEMILITVLTNKALYEKLNITVNCATSYYYFAEGLKWAIRWNNGTLIFLKKAHGEYTLKFLHPIVSNSY